MPAALMGIDLGALLDWSESMLAVAHDVSTCTPNPALGLGLILGAAARNGRDKLTLLCDPRLEAFGLWAEQLIAESGGKQGLGIAAGRRRSRRYPANSGVRIEGCGLIDE